MSSSLNCHYGCGPKPGTGPGTARITLAWGFKMTHPATISVVICVYTEKRWDFILEAIASVRAQIYPAAEIIVVTDYNEPLRQRLAEAEPGVRVIPNGEAKGVSGGRNTGIASATGDVVAFLDDDAAADPGWLSFMMAHFDRIARSSIGNKLSNTLNRRPVSRSSRCSTFRKAGSIVTIRERNASGMSSLSKVPCSKIRICKIAPPRAAVEHAMASRRPVATISQKFPIFGPNPRVQNS